jgi:hypothetical protein
MQVAYIASYRAPSGRYSLFNVGNYEYEITRLVQGEIQVVRRLVNTDCDQALRILQTLQ